MICIVDAYRKGRKTGVCPPAFEVSGKRQKLKKKKLMYQKLRRKSKLLQKVILFCILELG
jgi:hypothetical protein